MPRHILILDDQVDLLRILEREFNRRGDYVINLATEVAEATRIVAQKPVDLIVSDVRLGSESGFTFAGTIRELHPEIGLILMSAYRSPANRQTAESLGVMLFLEKPFPVSKLADEIESYFLRRSTPVNRTAETKTVPLESHITGSLVHFQVQDLVQLFCLNGRPMVISIGGEGGENVGNIYIQRGQVLHADLGELEGEKAFSAILNLRNPKLTVKDWNRPVPQTITSGWEHLLLSFALETDLGNENVQGVG